MFLTVWSALLLFIIPSSHAMMARQVGRHTLQSSRALSHPKPLLFGGPSTPLNPISKRNVFNISQLKNTYSAFIKEKAQFSPLNGAVWTESKILDRLYNFSQRPTLEFATLQL